MRKEVRWSLRENQEHRGPGWWTSDVELTFTRKGIEVYGFYDRSASIGPTVLISWDTVERYRQDVDRKEVQP